MPQIINTNIASLNAQRNLNASQRDQESALQRLSSGLRINSAKDDAAGLAISTRFDAQIRGTNVAVRNAGDAISLAQTAEGALDSINTSLQRIRELSIQSANDTNTDIDRAALQEEVDQLVAEIQNVAESANFNGKNLLDGSFSNATFQTGANVGDTIDVSIGKLDASALGSAATAGVSTVSSNDGDRSNSLAQGDLVINGIAVGAASASADGSSTANTNLSSIAIAAAINEVSGQSGVTAQVNENVVGGSTVTSVSATQANIDINGVTIELSGTGDTGQLSADLQGVANQINLFSGQTGVTASVDETNIEAGVTLTAADGRNIVLAGSGTAANYGLSANSAAGVAYTGSVNLISEDGSDIVITSDTGNSLENAGIEAGTYSGTNAVAVGDQLTGSALTAGDVVINGVSVGATYDSYDTASTANKSGSAIAIAAAVNLVSDQTNVTATANAAQVTSGNVTAATGGNFDINGVTVSYAAASAAGGTAEQVSDIVDAINGKTGQTGVVAIAVDDNQFELQSVDGRNIVLANTDANDGLSDGTNIGSVSLTSGGPIEISTKNTANIANSGFEVGTYGSSEAGTALKDIDITTAAGAEAAITAVDNAINTVASRRAELGAIQNRFESTISNLEISGENLSASNSRIKDADFAVETAALSRSQVLQQAGISVLAQANGRPQQVLSLLQ